MKLPAFVIALLFLLCHSALESAAFRLTKIAPRPTAMVVSPSVLRASSGGDTEASSKPLPRAIVFDLDGCLWTPEMYEIMYFMGSQGAPFRVDPDDKANLLTCGDKPVKLLGDVRSVFEEMYTRPGFETVQICISSRTDEPDWARELLEKFEIAATSPEGNPVCLRDILNGPIEIAQDSKVAHFERIKAATGIDYPQMVFFDNEFGNCERVASLGVSVVYCPDGVTSELWEMGIRGDFPRSDGSVINGNKGGGW